MSNSNLWTIGHSNHEFEHFLAMLQSVGIEGLADVRRFPGSRRQPQFQQDNLRNLLAEADIEYRHFPHLGGRRKTTSDTENDGWRVQSFNAYADHTQSEEFRNGLSELEEFARSKRVAMMCSEAVPWRCHRRLIGDALLIRDWQVEDIFAPNRTKPHKLTDFARRQGDHLIYPAEAVEEKQ